MEYKSLLETKNNLIIRISGLSDIILLEQAKEEYTLLEKKINSIEKEKYNNLINSIILDHEKYYRELYVESKDWLKCMAKINKFDKIDFISDLNKKRIKLTSNFNRYRILIMLNTINAKIYVLDLRGELIDEIGTGDKIYVLYINEFIDNIEDGYVKYGFCYPKM